MCILDIQPDDDPKVECPLILDSINDYLRENKDDTEDSLQLWYNYLIKFGHFIATTFAIDVSTKIHRTMGHDAYHIRTFGCLLRASSEHNKRKQR